LIDHGSIRHRLADARAELWAAEALLHGVVAAAMTGREVAYETAGTKLFCVRTAGRVIDECLQVLGGRGYTENYPLERYWRDARLARIGGGSDEVMRELIASGLDHADAEYDEWMAQLDRGDVTQAT
jgi:alkylation response protein AidB-like acyl-CoA dehydrogenase